jgi:hypothetical protein
VSDELPLSVPEAAKHFGASPSQLRRLFRLGRLPQPPRVGASRVVPRSKLGEIGEALKVYGCLRPKAASNA